MQSLKTTRPEGAVRTRRWTRRPSRTQFLWDALGWILFTVGVAGILLALCLLLALATGCGNAATQPTPTSMFATDTPTPKAEVDDFALSSETRQYLKKAMRDLAKMVDLYNDGEYDQILKVWKRIGDIPTTTTYDNIVADDYLAYANNVRYYMIEDGSVNLKQLEASREAAELAIAAASP